MGGGGGEGGAGRPGCTPCVPGAEGGDRILRAAGPVAQRRARISSRGRSCARGRSGARDSGKKTQELGRSGRKLSPHPANCIERRRRCHPGAHRYRAASGLGVCPGLRASREPPRRALHPLLERVIASVKILAGLHFAWSRGKQGRCDLGSRRVPPDESPGIPSAGAGGRSERGE